jgi:heptosyltransferase-2
VYLVVQTAFLGDMVLTTPLLERLSERGPVDVVATPANAKLLENHRAVRDVIVYDKRGAQGGLRGLRAVANAIRFRDAKPRNIEVAYMAQGSARSATLARMAGVKRIVGFDTSAGRWLYSERVHYDTSLHHAGRLLQLANLYDANTGVPRPTLYPSRTDIDAAMDVLGPANVERRIVVLAPGSVWATKRWPGYDALARLLVKQGESDGRVVVIGARDDAYLAASISKSLVDAGFPPAIDATGRLSLLGTAALMQRASLVITNDSAPLHLASAMNTPTVALFGPTVPAFGFGPMAERRVIVQHETLPCRPCDAHGPRECPLGHWRCMRQVEPERVAERARELMQAE